MATTNSRGKTQGKSDVLKVGLTGGIGAGKSTVAAELERCGAKVLSADQLARDVVAAGTDGFREVVATFGDDVVDEQGHLDRAHLAQIVFSAPEQLRALEAITHPRIATETKRFFAELPAGAVGVYDVPLLTEKQMENQFDLVIVVESAMIARIERLRGRGLAEAEARRRISAQATDQQRRAVADIIIDNSSDLEYLREAVETIARTKLGLACGDTATGNIRPRK